MFLRCSLLLFLPLILGASVLKVGRDDADKEEEEAKKLLIKSNIESTKICHEATKAAFAYQTNITDENQKIAAEYDLLTSNYSKELWKKMNKFNWEKFKDPSTKRIFEMYTKLGSDALSEDKLKEFNDIKTKMENIYSTAKICSFHDPDKCDLSLDPELKEIFEKSHEVDELAHVWEKFRDATGRKMRKMYMRYIQLNNEVAKLNNYTDAAEMMLVPYDNEESSNISEDVRKDVMSLWEQVKPLYLQMHAYVRKRLSEYYGEDYVKLNEPIPAHLLGYMDSEVWGNTLKITAPYSDVPLPDVTKQLVKQGYTPLKMFKLAETFFTSLNMSRMTPEFWKYSLMEKPTDREVVCHPTAWDLCNGDDVRVKMCSRVTMQDLITIHHEMGHIQYFLQYRDQPYSFRDGAHPGFHEAMGDVISLSVSTPKHLRLIGLLGETSNKNEEGADINFLFSIALRKLAILPYAIALDQWRWDAFQGKIDENQFNSHFWKIREDLQGIQPPVRRTEEDFDPGAKFHVPGGYAFLRYYTAVILQFQFHRSLCQIAGQYDPNDSSKPLHKCDIYGSTKAGNAFSEMLKLGSSKPWPDALEKVTGQRTMDAGAIREYFRPLEKWLLMENEREGTMIGWDSVHKSYNDDNDVRTGTEEPLMTTTEQENTVEG